MKKDENKDSIKKAAALKYNAQTDNAPQIVAIGEGHIANRMVDAAHENNVEVVKDKHLAHVLNELSVGDEIPEELYKVVAEILVFVSDLDNNYKKQIE